MAYDRTEADQRILMICEDMEALIRQAEAIPANGEYSPYYSRLMGIKSKVETERRMIEEISLPCRFILEHFSLFLGKWDYTIGFKYGKVQAGRGLLNDLTVAEWGNIRLYVGNTEIEWRDADYNYMFYPDKVILRPQDMSKSDIQLHFTYAFKYSGELSRYQGVKDDPQTIYWHEDLLLTEG